MSERHIETVCVRGAYQPKNGEPRQIPIIQSTTFQYATSQDMGALFDLEASGYFYSRLQNPTCDMVAAKIAALEGGTAGMLTSSGQAANFFAMFNLANCGDHFVSASSIYGGTFNLFDVTMRKMGIDVTFVSPDCTEEELHAAFRPNTKALFGETIANPALTVLDIEQYARVAHAHGVPLIVDNTFPTPVMCIRLSGARTSSRTPRQNIWTGTASLWAGLLWTPENSTGWSTPTSFPVSVRPTKAITGSFTRRNSALREPSSPRPPASSCGTSVPCRARRAPSLPNFSA